MSNLSPEEIKEMEEIDAYFVYHHGKRASQCWTGYHKRFGFDITDSGECEKLKRWEELAAKKVGQKSLKG